jgi:hypothetical protein
MQVGMQEATLSTYETVLMIFLGTCSVSHVPIFKTTNAYSSQANNYIPTLILYTPHEII